MNFFSLPKMDLTEKLKICPLVFVQFQHPPQVFGIKMNLFLLGPRIQNNGKNIRVLALGIQF